jgi:hypothetical protein
MNNQPEALRLADELTTVASLIELEYEVDCLHESATELRRLHKVNEELLEALEEIANAYAPVSAPEAYLMQKARAAIAKATGESKCSNLPM